MEERFHVVGELFTKPLIVLAVKVFTEDAILVWVNEAQKYKSSHNLQQNQIYHRQV